MVKSGECPGKKSPGLHEKEYFTEAVRQLNHCLPMTMNINEVVLKQTENIHNCTLEGCYNILYISLNVSKSVCSSCSVPSAPKKGQFKPSEDPE